MYFTCLFVYFLYKATRKFYTTYVAHIMFLQDSIAVDLDEAVGCTGLHICQK